MRNWIKRLLQKWNLYYPLKYSFIFHFYKRLFKQEVIQQEKKETGFYRSFLPRCRLIFDIGANDGHKTKAFLDIADRVVCCEPDEKNFRILRVRFRNKLRRVFLENLAVSDEEGNAEFHIHHPGSAFNTLSPKWKELLERDNKQKWNEKIQFSETKIVGTTTLDTLITRYGKPDFIKIDVEGFEPWVLRGLSQPVKYLSFESLLPDYYNELVECLDRLEQIDQKILFNIAKEERLLLSEFVTRKEIDQWIQNNKDSLTIEVIAKMIQ